MMKHYLSGRVLEKESKLPVVGIRIRAYDKDLIYDDLLGNATTDTEGKFQLEYDEKDYQEIFEGESPEIYFKLFSGPRSLIATFPIEKLNPEKKKEGQYVEIVLSRGTLGSYAPVPPAGFPSLTKDISTRKDIPAKSKLPEGISIEQNRIWASQDSSFEVSKSEAGDLIISKGFDLKRLEPPRIAFEALSREQIKVEGEKEYLGFIPDNLGVKFAPVLSKQLSVDILKGEDKPENVFPPEDRYVFNDTSFPWCTTGRVETSDGICTGTMIGRNLMLTASHCINWGDDSVGWIKFTPSYYNGSAPFGIAWGTRVIYWNRAIGGLTDFETAFDYVVVVLDRNMGDLTGYAGFRRYSTSWNNGNYWQMIGYPGDLTGTQRPTFLGGGSIWNTSSHATSGREGLVLGHFMDTNGGNSGGPVWGWWDNEPWPRVVGVHSAASNNPGFSTTGDNEAGGGEALSDLIAYARANF